MRYPEGVIVSELEAYEYVYTRGGVTYSAPQGQHDDAVCALALAVAQHQQVVTRGGMRLVGETDVDPLVAVAAAEQVVRDAIGSGGVYWPG